MSEIRIANRYAKSILELGIEQNSLSNVADDFAYLKAAFQHQELFNLIKSPIISKDKKRSIFSKLFTGKISSITDLFLQRVINKGRESIIPEMVKSFDQQYNSLKGIMAVKLTTTSLMTSNALEVVKGKINQMVGDGKQVNLEVEHDDTLIGGYVVEFEDKRYDASVKHQLDNIKKSFSA